MNRRTTIFIGCFAILCIGFALDARPRGQLDPPAQAGSPLPAQFAYGGDAAEIPAEFVGNIVFLPVRLNQSRPSSFVLDSTAPASSIDPARLAAAGISARQAPVLNLTGVDLPFAALPAIPRADFGWEIGRNYEGTLGGDFFQRVIVEIDYARHTVRLFDPAAYNYSGQGTPFHLTFAGGLPLLPVKFTEPRGKLISADFVVSTSIDASVVIFQRYADAHHIVSTHWKKIANVDPLLTGSGNAVVGRLKEIQLGRYTAQDMLTTFSSSDLLGAGDSHIAGVIGARMLARFTVVFDYPHQQLILAPNSHFPSDDQEDKSGISVIAKGSNLKTFEIVEVAPGTPAAKAGVEKGDLIAGIDQDPAADLTLAEIRDLFRQVGHKYTLVIDRSGQTRQITVEMKRQLE